MKTQALALAFLAATAISGIAWVGAYPLLSGEKKAKSRRAMVAKPEPASKRQAERSQRSRREQVALGRLLGRIGTGAELRAELVRRLDSNEVDPAFEAAAWETLVALTRDELAIVKPGHDRWEGG